MTTMHDFASAGSTLLWRGFREAYGRFILQQHDHDANFIALFETLNWAVSLIERINKDKDPDRAWQYPHEDMVKGLIYARNRLHHQWADALYITPSIEFPIQFPLAFQEWHWRPLAQLPPPDQRGQENLQPYYVQCLEGRPARLTLEELRRLVMDTIE